MIRVLGSTTDGFLEEVVTKCAIKYLVLNYCKVNDYFLYFSKILFRFSSQQGCTSNILVLLISS